MYGGLLQGKLVPVHLLATKTKPSDKVALTCFVDNVAVLAIEACLIKNLGEVFSPLSIMQMKENSVRNIAAESQGSQDQRELLTRKKSVLSSGLEICQRYVGRSMLGKVSRTLARLGSRKILGSLVVLADFVQRKRRVRSNRGREAQYQLMLKVPMRLLPPRLQLPGFAILRSPE